MKIVGSFVAGSALALALSASPMQAEAADNGFVVGANYGFYDFDAFDAGVLELNAGYNFYFSDNLSATPGFRLGTGISDDSLPLGTTSSVDVTVDRIYGPTLRVTYETGNGFYFFSQGSYLNTKASIKFPDGEKISDDIWEWSAGLGLGFNFTDRFGLEAAYENYDSNDVVQIGIRYRF